VGDVSKTASDGSLEASMMRSSKEPRGLTPFFEWASVPEVGRPRRACLAVAKRRDDRASATRGGPSCRVGLCSLIAARGGDGVRGGGRSSWLAMCGEPCTAARCVDPAALGFPSYSCPSGPTRGMLLPAEARNDAGCWRKFCLASVLPDASCSSPEHKKFTRLLYKAINDKLN